MSEIQKPFFTIFIPTYNRAYCVDSAIKSCDLSTFRDFEIVLIDDGSTDDTPRVVAEVTKTLCCPIRYICQSNHGKHTAFNRAVSLAQGELFLTLDSDDTLLPDALESIHRLWCRFDERQKKEFASIEFRCLENGVASSAYPEPYLDSDYLSRRKVCESRGEKRSAYRLDVLKEYPYPVFEGERYCRPGLIDIRIAKKYKTRFSNIVAIDAGHFPDGIGANRRKIIASAPKAYRQYFYEEITEHHEYSTSKDLQSYYKRFCRCSLNAGISLSQLFREVPKKRILLTVLPEAWIGSIGDKIRVARLQRAR